MKTVDERIENLSDKYLDVFTKVSSRINCGSLDCRDCPMQTDSGCMYIEFYEEKAKRAARTNEKAVETSTTELEAKAKELEKKLDHLDELLSKF